jgi:hypothetical protein
MRTQEALQLGFRWRIAGVEDVAGDADLPAVVTGAIGIEIILVVEDDETLRSYTVRASLSSAIACWPRGGYRRNAIVHYSRLDAGVRMIGKPFSFCRSERQVRALLDGCRKP